MGTEIRTIVVDTTELERLKAQCKATRYNSEMDEMSYANINNLKFKNSQLLWDCNRLIAKGVYVRIYSDGVNQLLVYTAPDMWTLIQMSGITVMSR
jgi:hypothetical protein